MLEENISSNDPLMRIDTEMISLANYHVTELIYQGEHTEVYRGRNRETGQPVAIKVMRNPYPSFRELVKFRNQYAIMLHIADGKGKNRGVEGIIQTYDLQRYENRYALIMEDMGGISLAEYSQRESLSLSEFLEIAIELAKILHHLHNSGIIHKDIKPANILIHPKTKQIKLIDFSISIILPKETQTLQTTKSLEGTLAYLSPEQTGRMNRAVDYRSDFYSLGVTFYELLMGALPFVSNDALELINAHMTLTPEPLSNWVVLQGGLCPEAISAIVMKLMAKNAEDRYQTALGLQYDLEKCLSQYQEKETIEPFDLGERDICDRFNIPEKLYGREAEVRALLDAFERVAAGNIEMMLVAGFSGIGKSAVIDEVHKPIVRKRGYFIKGKFDQFNRNIPFSALLQAFRSLIGQILSESDRELHHWQTQILNALGTNGQVLIDVMPELEYLIGKQPPVPELSGNAAQNRFNLLFQDFIAVFTTEAHPLTIVLDDLQWADLASLNLINLLMDKKDTGYLLVLGAYRDNEVFSAHPLMLTLAELQQKDAAISTITLAPLAESHINQLVAETLSCTLDLALPLTDKIHQNAQGNPFFSTQLLKGLYEDRLIVFNRELGYWECDLVRVQEVSLTADVVQFMAERLQKLPEKTQNVLQLAACIGNQFDLEILAIIGESSLEDVASELWPSLQEGVILPISEAYKFFQGELGNSGETPLPNITIDYRFLHDRVQQAAYSLIPEYQKQTTHLKIGRRLLNTLSAEERQDALFIIVGQLNMGCDLLQDPAERRDLAELNWQAGRKAKLAIAYNAAVDYLTLAQRLLAPDSWESDYQITLAIFVELLEAEYLNTNFERVESLAESILPHTQTLLDRIEIYEVKIRAWIGRGDQHKALETGLAVLQMLDIPLLDEQPDTVANIPELINAVEMSDPYQLAAMNIMAYIITPAWAVDGEYFRKITFTMVDLCLKHGNCASSAFGYVWYGTLLCESLGNIDVGYQFGQLSVALLDRFDAAEFRAKVLVLYASCIGFWKEHVKNFLSIHLEGLQHGLATGDLEFASYGAAEYSQYLFLIGLPLEQVQAESQQKLAIIENLKQSFHIDYLAPWLQGTLNLLGESTTLTTLEGEIYNEVGHLQDLVEQKQLTLVFAAYFVKSFLSYLFEDYTQALEHGKVAREHSPGVAGTLFIPAELFYSALAQIACLDDMEQSQKQAELQDVRQSLAKLKHWANYAPMNYRHKCDLIEAELARYNGNFIEAMERYDLAIAGAKENDYLQEEALANELAAKFYLHWGKEKFAALYMQQAYYCYVQWGAKAKTQDIEQRYSQLLQPILQGNKQSFLASSIISQITNHAQTQTATVEDISSIIDFSSLLKASQALSSEIERDRLLSSLVNIILENAGATKGALLLAGERGLTIEAIASRIEDGNQITIDSLNQSIRLEETTELPIGVINYVKRTKETALLSPKVAQEQFTNDDYLVLFQPQSSLCIPLLQRSELVGILYLENRLTADIFTRDRIEILDALCAQAAISLENSKLYQQAQQALQDLQQAQLQLVQNEKMAVLGNLVAGVAHEINNPVGFISGNMNAAREYLDDLLNGLELYEKNAVLPEEIKDELDDLDLEFISEDFPKLIGSMETGCDRIRNISTSLRTFSRADTVSKTEFNLHDGINSTLLILKYRLKANEDRPVIEIVTNYGDLPPVKCYAGQINQVFMNLLANAIDALEESNQGKTFNEIESAPNRITIATECDRTSVIIRIADNGMGMPAEVRSRIFEQGFTTKAVGKGTGLGMAIARQIVEEKHSGTIACESELGKGTRFIISLPIE